jgi:hypothetical protein
VRPVASSLSSSELTWNFSVHARMIETKWVNSECAFIETRAWIAVISL